MTYPHKSKEQNFLAALSLVLLSPMLQACPHALNGSSSYSGTSNPGSVSSGSSGTSSQGGSPGKVSEPVVLTPPSSPVYAPAPNDRQGSNTGIPPGNLSGPAVLVPPSGPAYKPTDRQGKVGAGEKAVDQKTNTSKSPGKVSGPSVLTSPSGSVYAPKTNDRQKKVPAGEKKIEPTKSKAAPTDNRFNLRTPGIQR